MNGQLLAALHAENHTRVHDETYIGQNLSIQNTVNAAANITVSGSSQQTVTVQGNNLFDINKYTISYGTRLSNGYNITAAAKSWMNGGIVVKGLLPSTKYYLSMDITRYTSTTTVGWEVHEFESNSYLAGTGTTTASTRHKGTFTTSATGNIKIHFYSNLTANVIDSNCDFTNIMLSLTDNSYVYEPFVPNSPSPEYPSAVNSVTGNLISSKKNLLDKDKFVEYRQLETGYVTITETGVTYTRKNGNTHAGAIVPVTLRAGQTYRLSFDFTTSLGGCWLVFMDAAGNRPLQINAGNTSGHYAGSITPTTDISFILFSNGGASAGEIAVTNLQLELGSICTAYEPYKGSLAALPTLGKIGDIADTYNPITGEFVQCIGYKEFDGTESILSVIPLTNTTKVKIWFVGAVANGGGSCTHFPYSWSNDDFIHWYPASDGFYFFVPSSLGITDSAGWIAWVQQQSGSGSRLKLTYRKAAPITISLATARLDTYYPETHITTDGAVKASLSASVKILGA